MRKFFNRYWLVILGIALGAAGGWLYWYFVGCANGTCAIASSPVNMTLWGAAVGGLLLSLFVRARNKDVER